MPPPPEPDPEPPLSPAQQDTLRAFRAHLESHGILKPGDTIGTDDGVLLRFLRARKFNLAHAIKMFADCQEWRRTVEGIGIDALYREIDPWDYPERDAVFRCWPLSFHKTDRRGRPVNIHRLGAVDMPALHAAVSPERHWRTILVNAESLTREVLPAASRAAGRRVDTVLVIVDLQGFGLSQFWQMKSHAQRSFQVSQDFFPETMGQLAIINAPASFALIWRAIRAWLSPETAAKVDVLGHDYRDALLRLVDAESLPRSMGGRCTCGAREGEGERCERGAGPWLEGRVWEGAGPGESEKADARVPNGNGVAHAAAPELEPAKTGQAFVSVSAVASPGVAAA